MKYGFLPRAMWAVFSGSFERAIGSVLHIKGGKAIMKQAHVKYRAILADVDEFPAGDRFRFNILSCATFAAVYLSLPQRPDVAAMTEYYRTAMDTPIMRMAARKSTNYTRAGRDALKSDAEVSQRRTNPYSWTFTVEDGATMNEYTATFTYCGIFYLMRKLGIGEITPALCHFDYDMAAMNNTVFTRKYTLASGGPCCDCHYCHHGK